MKNTSRNYLVLRISSNILSYPDCEIDTKTHPELVEYVEDEMDIFIYCVETKEFWKASDFFYDEDIRYFVIPEPVDLSISMK